MKVLCLSDLHGCLPEVDTLPEANLVLLAGDYCRDHRDVRWYRTLFTEWVNALVKRYDGAVCGVAGNHDWPFQKDVELPHSMNWSYLCDSGCEMLGLRIWGSPWQPRFHDWAFNLDEPELARKWSLIPDDTDILLLHGPPQGYGDFSPFGQVHTGSPSLLRRIEEIQPKVVVNGHIHSGYGVRSLGDTIIVNASHCDETYSPVNPPIVVELC